MYCSRSRRRILPSSHSISRRGPHHRYTLEQMGFEDEDAKNRHPRTPLAGAKIEKATTSQQNAGAAPANDHHADYSFLKSLGLAEDDDNGSPRGADAAHASGSATSSPVIKEAATKEKQRDSDDDMDAMMGLLDKLGLDEQERS